MIGVGGFGTVLSVLMAGAGVGKIYIVDGDVVNEENLSRQFLFRQNHIGMPKVVAAKEALHAINLTSKLLILRGLLKLKAIWTF
ncbi:hypothetical protein Heshes_26600 [Alicyclobacillus hesperidum]|uniref:ThiF family protein n=1 Tax=Alicyclobacillus hesperidum TaxID=89784 RepID=A0A1H2YJK2_9BACL|nr:hypothetical protein Heshes_26600 [Alicyclobacillus hesperidum]SDX05393.1 ThiF family protein [Alicyclobacillus hesperidum]